MTAQTTTQRTAKHRLAVKERLQRYEAALADIASAAEMFGGSWAATVAQEALSPTDTAKS